MMISDTNWKGAINEMIACAWLGLRGYDVFRNIAPTGPVDIVAWNRETRKHLLIDVKGWSTKYVRKDGLTTLPNPPTRVPPDVHILYVVKGEVIGFVRRTADNVKVTELYDPL
jgi:hypothetical protein